MKHNMRSRKNSEIFLLTLVMHSNYCDLMGLNINYCAGYNTCSIELR